ncbi:MAG TPA: cytochrome c biogenesis CcdA family protein [Candidatus Limnocylindrales bacterium]
MDVALTSFAFGLLATMSPCVLPLYPGFLAYLSGQAGTETGRLRYVLGVFVLAGVLTAMLILGAVMAALSVSIGRVLAILIPIAIVVILVLGVLLLLNRNPFYGLPQIKVPLLRRPWLNAYVYGLLYGPIAMPCSGPLVVAIFVYSFTFGEAAGKLWVFLWFGLGFGVPLLILSLLSGALQRQLTRWFARHSRAINVVGGLLLIAIAIYDLVENWDMLTLYYG